MKKINAVHLANFIRAVLLLSLFVGLCALVHFCSIPVENPVENTATPAIVEPTEVEKVIVTEIVEVTEVVEVIEYVPVEIPENGFLTTALDLDMNEFYNDAVYLAKTGWGEARGCSDIQVAAVYWCVLNRVDEGQGSIISCITAPNQFMGYNPNNPVDKRLFDLACDVLYRYYIEKEVVGDVGRVLPKEYTFFSSSRSGKENVFRDSYRGGNVWDFSLVNNPYKED